MDIDCSTNTEGSCWEVARILGSGVQHMQRTGHSQLDSTEYGALIAFWQNTASKELTGANVRKLFALAQVVPGFPGEHLLEAEEVLKRVNQ